MSRILKRFGYNRFFVLFASIVVNLSVFFAAIPVRAEEDFIRKGDLQAAPEVTLINAEGRVQTLADYRGKPVLLHFWATWCPPCIEELPAFAALQKNYPDMVLLPASLDRSTEIVQVFYVKHALNLPVLMDARQASMRAYKVRGLPSTIFINSKGQIAAVAEGSVNWQGAQAKEILDRLR